MDVVLVTTSLLTSTLAHRELVTTVTTRILGGRDCLDGGGDVVGRWFSLLWAGHHRPTICHHIAERGQSILISKLNVSNSVIWCNRFLHWA